MTDAEVRACSRKYLTSANLRRNRICFLPRGQNIVRIKVENLYHADFRTEGARV